MNFITDKQTLEDLDIMGRYRKNSIFSLFNHTVTDGGSRLLEEMFLIPLTNAKMINTRNEIFSFFQDIDVELPFNSNDFNVVENYLHSPGNKFRLAAWFNITKSKVMRLVVKDKEYDDLRNGLEKSITYLSKVKTLIEAIEQKSLHSPYLHQAREICKFFNEDPLASALKFEGKYPLNYVQVMQLDYIFRGPLNEQMQDLLKEIYSLDVYITVSKVARTRRFAYALADDQKEKYIDLKGFYHPFVPGAVANDLFIGKEKNVFFLTGANMAGKSTLMKAFTIAVYLAHMGFPVPAKGMKFTPYDGTYTSINVPDDLNKGYSHFYAEVLRVKKVAQSISSNKELLVIMDELFKGTNVKDAYDGTVAIVDAFSKRKGAFIIATHIMEAGETLRENNNKLFFKFLPTILKGRVPTYSYILEDGITDDRQGMMIIENEGIIDIINGKS